MAYAQSVTPDGSTLTNVSVRPSGQIAIKPADPVRGGVSHNRYDNFDVPKEGAVFDNGAARATVILNEVTGSKRSNILGTVSVEGQPAHVIVANPNGIEVDGGGFLNTGRVTLTTGSVAIASDGRLSIATGSGDIRIGSKGLAGGIQDLDLVARQIRIQGPVTAARRIELRGGHSQLEVVQAPTAELGFRDLAQSAEQSVELAVDISSRALVSGGSIRIAVNDRGAGVRLNDSDLAAAGRFQLDAGGQIDLQDATISAAGITQVKGAGLKASSITRAASISSSQSSLEIAVGRDGLVSEGARFRGVARNYEDLSSLGASTLRSAGSLSARGVAGFGASISGDSDDVVVLADGAIDFDGVELDAGRDAFLNGNKGIAVQNAKLSAKRDVRVVAGEHVSFLSSSLSSVGSIKAQGASLSVGAPSEPTQTSLKAQTGAVTFRSEVGDVVNEGALIEASDIDGGDPDSLGAITINAAGAFVNRSLVAGRIASVFAKLGDLVIDAGAGVRNETGRLLSNGSISISAVGDIENNTGRSEGEGAKRRKAQSGIGWRSLFMFSQSKKSYSVDYGELNIPGETSIVTAANDLTIKGKSFLNDGGQLSGDRVKVTTRDAIRNNSFISGAVRMDSVCGFFCTAKGAEHISTVFGSISANSELTLTSADSYRSQAGRLLSNAGIEINAPDVSTTALLAPFVVGRPGGLASLFMGEAAWIGWAAESSVIFADTGDLIVTSRNRARWSSTQFIVGGKKAIPSGEEIVAELKMPDRVGWRAVGFLSGIRP